MGVGKVSSQTEWVATHLVIQEGNHDDPEVATARRCHTEFDLSGEYHRYLPKDIQMEGRAGHKKRLNQKATARSAKATWEKWLTSAKAL